MSISKLLILFGLALFAVELLWPLIARRPRPLPGELVVERESFRLYIPIASSLLITRIERGAVLPEQVAPWPASANR